MWCASRLQLVIANRLLVDNHGVGTELDEGRVLPLATIYHILDFVTKVYHPLLCHALLILRLAFLSLHLLLRNPNLFKIKEI